MHMVPVAVLPEPSEKESIVGVRVSRVVGGEKTQFPIPQRCHRKYGQSE